MTVESQAPGVCATEPSSDEQPRVDAPAAGGGEPALREQILLRFAQWLDEALTGDESLAGLPAELLGAGGTEVAAPAPDLHTLFSALTVMSQEVKLQGRAFQGLSEGLAREEQLRAKAGDQARRGERELLELLVDLRDRLGRGLAAVSAQRERLQQLPERTGLWRLLGLSDARLRPVIEATFALAQGYELSVRRLEDALHRLHLEEIECLGRPFDPHLMKAVELLETSASPEGQVVEVCRPGYRLAGELFRAAEVRVTRQPRPQVPALPKGIPT